jgi:hypothetical protein
MGLLALLLRMPLTAGIFHMDWLAPAELLGCAAFAGSAVLWHEVLKFRSRH